MCQYFLRMSFIFYILLASSGDSNPSQSTSNNLDIEETKPNAIIKRELHGFKLLWENLNDSLSNIEYLRSMYMPVMIGEKSKFTNDLDDSCIKIQTDEDGNVFYSIGSIKYIFDFIDGYALNVKLIAKLKRVFIMVIQYGLDNREEIEKNMEECSQIEKNIKVITCGWKILEKELHQNFLRSFNESNFLRKIKELHVVRKIREIVEPEINRFRGQKYVLRTKIIANPCDLNLDDWKIVHQLDMIS